VHLIIVMIRLVFWALLAVVIISSCDNPKSSRHLYRAANRASQIENEKPAKTKNDYLISFIETKDSTGNAVFTALYTLPKDTSLFFWNISLDMPEKLGFDGRLDTCTVNAFFFKSATDTTNNKFVIQKNFSFIKSEEFYRIKEK